MTNSSQQLIIDEFLKETRLLRKIHLLGGITSYDKYQLLKEKAIFNYAFKLSEESWTLRPYAEFILWSTYVNDELQQIVLGLDQLLNGTVEESKEIQKEYGYMARGEN